MAAICPKCGHLEHKSRMHQNICTHYMPADGAECGCSYQRPQSDPAEAERKPAGAHQYFAGLLCPRCAAGDRPEWRIVFQTWCHVWTTANGHSHCPAELIWKDLELHGGDPQPAALEELMAAAEETARALRIIGERQLEPGLIPIAAYLEAALARCREVLK